MCSGSRCRYWQCFISFRAGNTKQTQLSAPSESRRVYLLNEWTQGDWKACWTHVSQLPTLLPTRFWEQVAVKSNPGRKHLLLRKRKQGGQDRHEGKRVRFCPQIAQGTLRQVAPLHCSSWGSAKMVTIYPCFLWGRLIPQLSFSTNVNQPDPSPGCARNHLGSFKSCWCL